MADVCKNCGAAIEEGAEVCAACGAAVEVTDSEYLGGKDPRTMAFLAGFLGAYGFPYWFFGETKKGIIRCVLTCCTCGIGAIVMMVLSVLDAFKIDKGEYEVDPDKAF